MQAQRAMFYINVPYGVAILAQAISFVLSAVRVAYRSWAWTQAPRHSVLAQRNAAYAVSVTAEEHSGRNIGR
eukprot:13971443-Heterocapsa_arctica.AAC.1